MVSDSLLLHQFRLALFGFLVCQSASSRTLLPSGTAGIRRIEPLCRVSTRCVLSLFIAAAVALKLHESRENLSRKQRLTRA